MGVDRAGGVRVLRSAGRVRGARFLVLSLCVACSGRGRGLGRGVNRHRSVGWRGDTPVGGGWVVASVAGRRPGYGWPVAARRASVGLLVSAGPGFGLAALAFGAGGGVVLLAGVAGRALPGGGPGF